MKNHRPLIQGGTFLLTSIILVVFYSYARAATFIVPDQYPTIQQAIDAASPGDTILVRPGTYNEQISINKSISLIAAEYNLDDPAQNSTVIDSGPNNLVPTVYIGPDLAPMPVIKGFVIQNGKDGIDIRSEAVIENNFFLYAIDQMDYEAGGGGIISNNVFYGSGDDGIDLDNLNRDLLIINNKMMYNGDDCIEIRLNDSSAPTETVTAEIRDNMFIGCEEDGIQLIDYGQTVNTNRKFIIAGNLFANIAYAGIGMMPDSNTIEDFSGADVIEIVHTYNNTFYGNRYGISGGDNHVAFNNIFANSIERAVWNVQGMPQDDSVIAYSLFWNNGIDTEASEIGDGNIFGQDPLFAYLPNPGLDGIWYTVDDDFYGLHLMAGSPAIDTGITQFISNSGIAIPDVPISSFTGLSPDLGWKELGYIPSPTATPTATPVPTATPAGYGEVISQVNSSDDDAEEEIVSGDMDLTSSDLEFGADKNVDQWIGMVFRQINIPQGAHIINAYIEFEVDETGSDPTSVTFYGQAADNASNFTSQNKNISSREMTAAQVAWDDIPPWTTISAKWNSPNLAPIVQEIVDRSLWSSGNSMAIFISGTGERKAESFNGEPQAAPKLVIGYTTGPTPTPQSLPTNTPTPTPTATLLPPPPGAIRFAVIGDYGSGSQHEGDVSDLVKSWNADFIITTGDNNYPDGEAATIDQNIGQFFNEFIYPYLGSYGAGATVNRFFPSLGNHDWNTADAQPHMDYFTLPGNERYYDFIWGPIHFFAIDSDSREPDGRSSSSTQALWLQAQLAASTSPWQVVYMHHAPYSSGATHGSSETMRWPYQEWGADAVLAGHDHLYERLIVGDLPYFVNGLGGSSIYNFDLPLPESQARFNSDFGAMLVEANDTTITFQFITRLGNLIDTYTLSTSPTNTATPTDTATSTNTPTSTATSTPVTPSPTPVTPSATPVTPSPTPVTPSPTPVTPSPTPVTPSPTPVTPSATPVTPSPTPVTPSPTPVTPSPTPVTPSPTPVTPSATPVTPSPTPVTPSPTPITPSPTQPPEPSPTPTTAVITSFASSDLAVAGTVTGDYLLTHQDDGSPQSITERLSGGKPQFRYSYLEHKWLFSLPEGNNTTFNLNAWSSGSNDGDDFAFSYSTDDLTYTEMFSISNTTDEGFRVYSLPPILQGSIYIRVIDSTRTSSTQPLDSVFIDQMFIRAEIQPGTPPLMPTDLVANALSGNQIQLNWTDNATDEFGYYIERSTDNVSWLLINTTGPDATSFLDGAVFPSTLYYYRIRAFNASGVSNYSNVVSTSTPSGLVLTGFGYKVKAVYKVDLAWSGGTGPTYDVYRDSALLATNIGATMYTDSLEGKSNHLYQVCEANSLTACSNIVLIDF